MRMRIYGRRLTLAFMLALAPAMGAGALAEADQNDDADNVADSLDDELLRELQEELLDETKKDTPPDADLRKETKDKDRLDEQLKRKLGEDVGLAPEDDPLSQIVRLMRRAEERTAEADTSGQTRKVQEQIVDNLDRLIKQTRQRRRQKKQGGSGKPSGSQRSKARQPGQSGQQGAQQPGRNSTNRLGRAAARQVDMAQMKDLLKDLWGHLPARTREEMINSLDEQFLPKYEIQIEKYFKRLAEDPNRSEIRP